MIEVKDNNYQNCAITQEEFLISDKVDKEIIITFFSPDADCVIMARNLSEQKLKELLQNHVSCDEGKLIGLYQVKLIGKDLAGINKEAVENIKKILLKYDNGNRCLDIKECDISYSKAENIAIDRWDGSLKTKDSYGNYQDLNYGCIAKWTKKIFQSNEEINCRIM